MRSCSQRTRPRGAVLALLLLPATLHGGCARVGFAWRDAWRDGGVEVGALEAAVDFADAAVDLGDGGDHGAGEAGADGARDLGPDGPSPGGTHLWSRRLGREGALGRLEIATSSAGGGSVVMAAPFRGSVDVGGGALVSGGAVDMVLASFAQRLDLPQGAPLLGATASFVAALVP